MVAVAVTAEAVVAAALFLTSRSSDEVVVEGDSYHARGKHREAIGCYRRALARSMKHKRLAILEHIVRCARHNHRNLGAGASRSASLHVAHSARLALRRLHLEFRKLTCQAVQERRRLPLQMPLKESNDARIDDRDCAPAGNGSKIHVPHEPRPGPGRCDERKIAGKSQMRSSPDYGPGSIGRSSQHFVRAIIICAPGLCELGTGIARFIIEVVNL
jgi:hypothetical protein